MKPHKLLWALVAFLTLIGVAIVLRRMFALASVHGNPGLDEGFAQHRLLTTLHILPGLVFVLLGPLQFIRRLRQTRPRVHRWTGRIFVVAALIVGVTALVMSPQMAIGGALETTATSIFGALFLFCLCNAYRNARRRRFALHREWMIRTYAIGLAVTSIRPIVGVFFATQKLTHLTPHDFFGIAFWLGFTIQTATAELYIRRTRPA